MSLWDMPHFTFDQEGMMEQDSGSKELPKLFPIYNRASVPSHTNTAYKAHEYIFNM